MIPSFSDEKRLQKGLVVEAEDVPFVYLTNRSINNAEELREQKEMNFSHFERKIRSSVSRGYISRLRPSLFRLDGHLE